MSYDDNPTHSFEARCASWLRARQRPRATFSWNCGKGVHVACGGMRGRKGQRLRCECACHRGLEVPG